MNKAFKLALLSSVFCLVPSVAGAEPVSLSAAIFLANTGFISSSIAAIQLTSTIISTALTLGASLGANLLLGGRPSSGAVPSQEVRNTIVTPETGGIYIVGRARVAGALLYGNTASRTKYRLLGINQGQIDAVEDYYLNNVSVVVDSDGKVSSPPWSTPSAQYAYVYFKNGTDDLTTYSDLTSAFTEWTSNHRARGITQLLGKYPLPALSSDLYLQLHGKELTLEALARGALFYDPREVSHDIDDDSTWEWTDNGVIVAANVMAQCEAFGYDGIDWDIVAAEADKADVTVSTKTGTEPRARASGVFFGNQPGEEIVSQMLDSIGAYAVPFNGKWQILLDDDAPAAEMEFADSNIVDVVSTGGPEGPSRPNICRVKYLSPERNYRESELVLDGVAWAEYTDEIAAVGEKPLEIRLPFCPSAAQASRIARRLFAKARAKRGTLTTNLTGMAAWSMNYVSARLGDGESVATLQIDGPQFDGVNEVTIPFVEAPALAAFVPATDEGDPAPEVPAAEYESTLAKPAAPTKIIQVDRVIGGGTEMRIRGANVSPNSLEINYRTYTGGLPNNWTSTNEIGDFAWVDGDFTSAGVVDVRQRQFAGDEYSQLSDIYQEDAVLYDNTTPSAVDNVVDNWQASTPALGTLSFDAPDSLQAAYYEVFVSNATGLSDPDAVGLVYTLAGSGDIRPNQSYTTGFIAGPTASTTYRHIRIYAKTSNGTASVAATISRYLS